MHRCRAAEERIQLRAAYERGMNVDNFDSGAGVEDVVREEVANVLPRRYSTKAGVLNDRHGKTGGDYDLVIFNAGWTPVIKAGATAQSRRVHLPIEGVYAVGEVKQTLDFVTLDDAMRKLIVAHRLFRPPTSRHRIVENWELDRCSHGLTNPLYSFVLATRLAPGIEFEALIRRFVEINQQVRRLELVRSLCVLGHGTVHWVYRDEAGNIQPALFMGDDLKETLDIGLEPSRDAGPAFFTQLRSLMLHLYHCVLAPEDVAACYGPSAATIRVPSPEEELTHSPVTRATPSESVPWDVEWNPLWSGEVDEVLGAHTESRSNSEAKESQDHDNAQ